MTAYRAPQQKDQTMLEASLIDRFVAIVGAKHALTDEADIDPHMLEWRKLYKGVSPLVLKPANTGEVSAIVKLAAETNTAIVPQGGNTGLVGAQIPDQSGQQIVLSLSRLSEIREIDTGSNTITVGAGATLQSVQQAANGADRLFPLSLASEGICQIGGNLSSNAGGTAVLAYGNMRELCLGVEAVLPNGEILNDLLKLKKDNTGYDLKNLLIGAEGTLGIITAAVLKLFPKPIGHQTAWVAVKSPDAALDLLNLALAQAGNSLAGFELCQKFGLSLVEKYQSEITLPFALNYPWYVLLEVTSGRAQDDAEAMMESIIAQAMEQGLIADGVLAVSLSQRDQFWAIREAMSESQKFEGGSIKHDISVPVNAIPEFIIKGGKAAQSVVPEARLCCFGHMGDGNLHFNVSQPVGMDAQAYLDQWTDMNEAVHQVVLEFDGSISAEHGIGILKRDALDQIASPTEKAAMHAIKKALDPQNIMNPGKLLKL